MKNFAFTSLVLALVLTAPVIAQPGKSAVSITVKPTKVVYSRSAVFSGQIAGTPNAGIKVQLRATPSLTGGDFKTVGAAVSSDAGGAYSIRFTPQRTMRYQVVAKTKPPATSRGVTVAVALKVRLRPSDTTPAVGQRVRFFGSVYPGHDGRTATLQRRTYHGWKSVATSQLVAAPPANGVTRSRYAMSARVLPDAASTSRIAAYRVLVRSGDHDHANGKSSVRELEMH